jgi:hypothetical protein
MAVHSSRDGRGVRDGQVVWRIPGFVQVIDEHAKPIFCTFRLSSRNHPQLCFDQKTTPSSIQAEYRYF